MLDLRRLAHAAALARTRSYIAAAEAVGITQPALSRSIQSLEAKLGLRLFDRGRGGVTLTDAGRQLVARAELLLRDAQALEETARAHRAGVHGEVRMGVGPLIASASLTEVLPLLLADFPGVDLRVTIAGGAGLQTQLMVNELDFAVCAAGTISARDDLAAKVIGSLPLALLVRRDHPLAEVATASEVSRYPLIGGSGSGGEGPAGWYRPQLTCDNFEILCDVALSSDAVWIASPAAARDCLAAGDLRPVRCDELMTGGYRVALVTPWRRSLSRAAMTVRERLITALSMHFESD